MSSREGKGITMPGLPDQVEHEGLSRDLATLAGHVKNLQLVGEDQPDAYLAQDRSLAEWRGEASTILHEIGARLGSKSRLRRNERLEVSRLYVTALLLRLDMELFFTRWKAPGEWFEEGGAYGAQSKDAYRSLKQMEQGLRSRGVRLAAPAYHAIATDLRAWADKLSPESSTASGWLGVAPEISRQLRYKYNVYRTKELWARLRGPGSQRKGFAGATPLLLRASSRSFYGAISGYGLRGGRFVMSVMFLLLAFGGVYWALDWLARCPQGGLTWLNALDHFVLSLGIFTTLGTVGSPMCAADGAALQRVASFEALTGYVMLSMLISVFWMAFHESVTGASNMRIRETPPRPAQPAAATDGARQTGQPT